MKGKFVPVLHPPLFAIFPVIFLYAQNMNEIFLGDILLPLGFMLAITLTLWFVLNIFYKSWYKSGMVISCIVLFMFSYGHIVEKLISTFNLDIDTHAPFFVISWFTLLTIVLLGIFKIKKSLLQWTQVFNFIALCLIILNGINILPALFQSNDSSGENSVLSIADSNDVTTGISNPPNIFYLVFDGHIGSLGLRQLGRNNDWFTAALKERGFFVAEESHSNYIKTPMSLASSLNYTYLDHLSENVKQTDPELTDLKKLYPLLDSNRVFRFLKKQGYETIHCPTDTIFFVHDVSSADLVINESSGIWNGITLELARNTPFFKNKWVLANLHRNRILGAVKKIKELKNHPKPFIVFAHILSPHFPAVFDENGAFPKKPTEQTSRSPFLTKIEKYIPQMEFMDKQATEIIDYLQNDPNPPVIIIQGDHGIRDLIENQQRVTNSQSAQIAFSILNAYYLPGYDKTQLYDSISPVNTFRILFNHYFGTDLELLADRSFFCSKTNLYDFQDVTEFLRDNPHSVPGN